VKKFLAEHVVPVWIDDKKDDPLAAKLGLSQEGYPNIAVYDGAGEYLGRVIGFAGRDPWFKGVEETWAVGAKIAAAKAAATADPVAWSAFAAVVGEIPGREKDARDAMERIPEAKRPPDYAATHASWDARAAWVDVEKSLRKAMQTVKSPDDAKALAPKQLEAVEAWIKDHGGASAKADAVAWSRKGSYLVLLDRKAAAVEVAVKILHDWPESPQAQAILRGLR